MASKIFKLQVGSPAVEKIVLCDFSGEYLGINQVNPKQEIIKVECRPASYLSGSGMFFINCTEFLQYYVWYNKENNNKDPMPGGKTGIEVKLLVDDTDLIVATKTAQAIDAVEGFSAVANSNIVTITVDAFGDVYPAADYNTKFKLVIDQKGQYTTSLFTGKLWPDCKEIKDVILHEDGSAEIFFTLVKTHINKMNLNKRFDINKEFFIPNYRKIPAGWLSYI